MEKSDQGEVSRRIAGSKTSTIAIPLLTLLGVALYSEKWVQNYLPSRYQYKNYLLIFFPFPGSKVSTKQGETNKMHVAESPQEIHSIIKNKSPYGLQMKSQW